MDASAQSPRLVRDVDALRAAVRGQRKRGRRIGLVPTMGALHAGHLSLVKKSELECDITIVTIFVNPTQFAPSEDLDKYPRTLTEDLDQLAKLGGSIVFAPTEEQIYPPGFSTFVEPPAVAMTLEGAIRPEHFRGVATVVLKLFNLVQADVAYFGQKDYQQCRVIEKMVEDLAIPISIRICPIIREADGLAMSSRNVYLSADERVQALALSAALAHAEQMFGAGERNANSIQKALRRRLEQAGIAQIDYVHVAHPDSLQPLDEITDTAIVLLAANVGKTRLIDNCLLR